MVEPIYGDEMETLYSRLPGCYRDADVPNDYVLKTWLNGLGYQLSEAGVFLDRFRYDTVEDGGLPTDTCELVNPLVANEEWLPWIAQLLGLNLRGINSVQERRNFLADPNSAAMQGTTNSMIAAAQTALSGTKFVQFLDHTTDVSSIGGAGEWDVTILVNQTEVVSDPVQAVLDIGMKPAGVKLYTRSYSLTWATWEATFPTWADLEGKTWLDIENTGI
jgi:hypothetical protein